MSDLKYDKARRTILTEAQQTFLATHPEYVLCGRPQPGISFRECGTLYADGRFDPMAPMKPVKLEENCRLIGIPSDLYLTEDEAAMDHPSQGGKSYR